MFSSRLRTCVLAASLCIGLLPTPAFGHKRRQASNDQLLPSESVAVTNGQSIVTSTVPAQPLVTVQTNSVTVQANTSSPVSSNVVADTVGETISSTALVIARDSVSAYSAYSVLNDHGIPYTVLIVPMSGAELPSLNDTATEGNFGLIVVLSEVSYDYGGALGFESALTADQWISMFNYQSAFGVRMVRLDVFPSGDIGVEALGGCCNGTEEQLMSISDDSDFPTAGLRVGATVSTVGLWHYPAVINNHTIAKEIAQFAPADVFSTPSTAAVINNIGGRQQMVFFTSFATDWSLTSSFLSHVWVNWATRGLYAGYRRALLPTQIDDMFLESDIYDPPNTTFRIGTDDLANHITFMATINANLNPGSDWWMEIGHNGNGNIEQSDDTDQTGRLCKPGPIEYPDQIDTPLEFVKPLGTGTALWPATSDLYPNYTAACMETDPLLVWWQNPANLNAFSHITHTFTHEDQDNATYGDVFKEMTWNQAWLAASGIGNAEKFSPIGLIPPAITGLHNGDALKAWSDAGFVFAVGDNTRPALLNTVNEHWPLLTTLADDGFAGMVIIPRWATNIYYNCDLPGCTVLEWINTSAGAGDITTLLGIELNTNVRHLLGLHHDAYMFHQANLRFTGAPTYTINGVTQQLSLFQAWMETVTQEFVRLVTWPLLNLKHDDLAQTFMDRMNRDACSPNIIYQIDKDANTIVGVTVTANGNTCAETLPVTFPGPVTDTQGFTTEQLGSDPLTIWVALSGEPVSFTLVTPVAL